MAYLTRQQAMDIINKAPSNLNKETLLKELARTNTIEGYNEPEKKSSFLQNFGREIAKPFVQTTELLGQGARTFGQVAKAGVQSITNKEKARQTLDAEAQRLEQSRQGGISLMGEDVSRVRTGKQAVGTALNLASNFVGGGGAVKAGGAALKTGIKSAIKTGSKIGAKAGALYGAGEAISEDRNVLKGAATGALGGAIAGAALPAAGSALVGTAKTLASPFSTAINKLAPALDRAAVKIENVLVKPSKTDIRQGFKAENVFKYDLGGTLGQSLKKTDTLLGQLRNRAMELRGKSKSVIDIKKIMSDLGDEVATGKIESKGAFKEDIQRAFTKFVTEIEGRFPDGKTNSVDAQILKEFIGDLGSWVKGSRDLNANSMEAVANSLYTKVKKAIENSVGDPKELQAINKQFSEILPIKTAIIRRLPIAEKNQVLGLGDMVSLGAGIVEPKAWGLFIINRLAKSGRFANLVSKGSSKLKGGATKLLPLEKGAKTYLKNIKPGLTIEDVSKQPLKAKGETLKTNLAKEAKKYKSADEFVKKIQNESNIGQSGKLQEIPLNKITGSDYPELDSALKSGKLSFDEADGFLPDNELLSKKREVIMPIEVIKNNNGAFSLQAGNHRVSQQLINGNRNILANVSNQSGNVKQQLIDIWNKANGKTPLKKTVNTLEQEAKKYKSADEFVKAQRISSIQKKKLLGSGEPILVHRGINNSGKNFYKGDKELPFTYYSLNKTKASKYGNVSDYIFDSSGKTFRGSLFEKFGINADIENPNIINKLKNEGYGSAIIKGDELVVFDKNLIKTKLQLKEIWDRVNK